MAAPEDERMQDMTLRVPEFSVLDADHWQYRVRQYGGAGQFDLNSNQGSRGLLGLLR
jgi:hypothetical protein